MINLGTFIVCCALCLFMGLFIGEQIEFNRDKSAIEDLRKFYHENTKSLVAYIEKMNEKKGGK